MPPDLPLPTQWPILLSAGAASSLFRIQLGAGRIPAPSEGDGFSARKGTLPAGSSRFCLIRSLWVKPYSLTGRSAV